MARRFGVVACALVIASCEGRERVPAGGVSNEGQTAADASVDDAGGLRDAGARRDAGQPADAGPCTHAPSQPMSAPCCPALGADACGALLVCAALDGRTIATCYPERSRALGETCAGDRLCLEGTCSAQTGLCMPGIGQRCTAAADCSEAGELAVCANGRCARVACDPLDGAGCAPGETCDGEWEGSVSSISCRPVGTRGEGETCAGPRDCAEQLHCFTGERDGRCRALCSAASGCAASRVCIQLGTLGVCMEPCPAAGRCPSGDACIDFGGTSFCI